MVIPISFWHVAARSKDFSLVDPPAPHVTVTNKGLKASIRFNLANKFLNPESVFGGKNSNETNFSSGFKEAIRSATVLIGDNVDDEMIGSWLFGLFK